MQSAFHTIQQDPQKHLLAVSICIVALEKKKLLLLLLFSSVVAHIRWIENILWSDTRSPRTFLEPPRVRVLPDESCLSTQGWVYPAELIGLTVAASRLILSRHQALAESMRTGSGCTESQTWFMMINIMLKWWTQRGVERPKTGCGNTRWPLCFHWNKLKNMNSRQLYVMNIRHVKTFS